MFLLFISPSSPHPSCHLLPYPSPIHPSCSLSRDCSTTCTHGEAAHCHLVEEQLCQAVPSTTCQPCHPHLVCQTELVEDCQEDGGTSCSVTKEQECSLEEVEECVNTVVECEDICTTQDTEECVVKNRQVSGVHWHTAVLTILWRN